MAKQRTHLYEGMYILNQVTILVQFFYLNRCMSMVFKPLFQEIQENLRLCGLASLR
jgi:hypothetical protein